MKLIKLNEEDYIIVDDSEIKEKAFFINEHNQISVCVKALEEFLKTNKSPIKKITHSNKPLEDVIIANKYEGKGWINIKPLSLSEIEELLFGYSVEKMANSHCEEQYRLGNDANYNSFIEGFNAHKELVKDKLFTVDDMFKVFKHGILFNQETVSNCKEAVETEFDLLIKSLQQPTEWNVEFISGKLTLKD